jgi:hypothetical protein
MKTTGRSYIYQLRSYLRKTESDFPAGVALRAGELFKTLKDAKAAGSLAFYNAMLDNDVAVSNCTWSRLSNTIWELNDEDVDVIFSINKIKVL